jgi:uncharacterized iron-regulated membrane protein
MKLKPDFNMSFRTVLFWMHLTAGATAGLVVFVMSLTGVLLTYERQITEWADAAPSVSSPPGSPAPLGLEALAAHARAARGTWPGAIIIRSDAKAPVAFSFGRETLFLDPWSGAVLSQGSSGARSFFRTVTDWHRWLGQSGDARPLARAITGAANLVFLFIVLSGIYLWWPRSLLPRHLGPVTLFQPGLAGRSRDFNWHNVFGFWSALPLALVVASGVVMSYPWANDLVFRLAGSEPPRRAAAPTRAAPVETRAGGTKPEVSLAGLDRAWTTARAQMAGWRTATLRVPNANEAPFSFGLDSSTGARRPSTRGQAVVDRRSGELVRYEPYAGQPRGQKVRGWLRFAHTGEVFGAFGQTVAGLASAGAMMLVWTGLSLALRRFAAWRKRRARIVETEAA